MEDENRALKSALDASFKGKKEQLAICDKMLLQARTAYDQSVRSMCAGRGGGEERDGGGRDGEMRNAGGGGRDGGSADKRGSDSGGGSRRESGRKYDGSDTERSKGGKTGMDGGFKNNDEKGRFGWKNSGNSATRGNEKYMNEGGNRKNGGLENKKVSFDSEKDCDDETNANVRLKSDYEVRNDDADGYIHDADGSNRDGYGGRVGGDFEMKSNGLKINLSNDKDYNDEGMDDNVKSYRSINRNNNKYNNRNNKR